MNVRGMAAGSLWMYPASGNIWRVDLNGTATRVYKPSGIYTNPDEVTLEFLAEQVAAGRVRMIWPGPDGDEGA